MNKAVTGTIKGVIGAASTAANLIASPEGNPATAMIAAGDAASKFGDKIALLSPGLGYFNVAVGETTKAFGSLMQNLDQTANKYGEYNGAIAQQQALAEVRVAMGDLRRAQEAGPDLARYVQAQADLQQKYEDVKIKLLTKILGVVNPALEVLEKIMPSGEYIGTAVEGVIAPLTVIATIAGQMLGIQQNDRIPDVLDPTDVILNNTRLTPEGQVPPIFRG